MFSSTANVPRRAAGPRRSVAVQQRLPAPYAMTPTRRTARMLLAPRHVQALLRQIERSADQRGVVLEWSHDAVGLREWQWPTHDTSPRLGSYVAASGLRIFMAERGIPTPVCLHGRDQFRTREECFSKLLVESIRGKKHYKFVCSQYLEDDDCFYEVSLEKSPAIALRNRVFNPAFVFNAPPEHLYAHIEVLDEDLDEDRNPSTPPGLAAFAHETPEMPVQVPNSAARVETRALLALNSAAGLPIDYLTSLHRLLQHCKYCDTVGLPAAMRDHIRTGACRRFIFEAEDHDN